MTKGVNCDNGGTPPPVMDAWFHLRVPPDLKLAYEEKARAMSPPTHPSALARWVLEEWIAGRIK